MGAEADFWETVAAGRPCWAIVLRGQRIIQVRGQEVRDDPPELLCWTEPGMPGWRRVATIKMVPMGKRL